MTEDRAAQLRDAYRRAGQGHVFQWFDRLDAPARAAFLDQLAGVDLALLARLARELERDRPIVTLELDRLQPAPFLPLPETPGQRGKESRARRAGEEVLRAGKACAFIVAGGQGSRLGFEGPKGCFPVGPVSGRSLFAWHFGKVAAARRRHGAAIPLLVMTSAANHQATLDFFRRHQYFGLPEADVLVFQQGMLPAMDGAGRLLLAGHASLFLSPDGHGGALSALARAGILDELERRGIEEIFYFQVDNPLVKVLDPVFLGHHRQAGSEMSSKFVRKRDAAEKVGVFARAGRRVGIVEYSDLPAELAEAKDAAGELLYGAGNIAIHVLAVAFVRRLTAGGELRLPYHRARKAIPHVGPAGEIVQPAAPNGVKFESFVFDALPLAKKPLLVEARRDEEFSPVKNATGADSPATCRADLQRLFRSWLADAGFRTAADDAVLEVAPGFAADRDEFVHRVTRERVLGDRELLLG